VNIQLPENRRETPEERKDTDVSVDRRREYEISACIVRVMKARKTAKHNDLIVEVVEQLKKRFIPEPAKIKSCIESLIEKDYMERAAGVM